MPNPTQFSWADATTNTDGTPLVAGEITGYNIGVRSTTAAGSVAGVYPMLTKVTDPAATKEALNALTPILVPGSYAAAIQSTGPIDSAWSTETTFSIVPPTPSSPTNFSVA